LPIWLEVPKRSALLSDATNCYQSSRLLAKRSCPYEVEDYDNTSYPFDFNEDEEPWKMVVHQ